MNASAVPIEHATVAAYRIPTDMPESDGTLSWDATTLVTLPGMVRPSICEAFGIPLSSHCAPTLHLPLCCAAQQAVHLEYFHDHARIEQMLFDGAVTPDNGALSPDTNRPGLGFEFKEQDAQCYLVS